MDGPHCPIPPSPSPPVTHTPAQTNRSPVQQPSSMSSSQTPQDQFDDGNTPRVVRKNDLEELIEVLDKLLQFRWTTHKFLETITRYREHNRVRRAYGQFKSYAYGSIFRRKDNPIGNKDWEQLLDTHGLNQATRLLRSEIETLLYVVSWKNASPVLRRHW